MDFTRLAIPSGLFANEDGKDCRIPFIGEAYVKKLKDAGVRSYDAVTTEFYNLGEDGFIEWLTGMGIPKAVAKQVAIVYAEKLG